MQNRNFGVGLYEFRNHVPADKSVAPIAITLIRITHSCRSV